MAAEKRAKNSRSMQASNRLRRMAERAPIPLAAMAHAEWVRIS